MFNYLVSAGTILKEYLDTRNISQKELAAITESSEKHISNIINGKAQISIDFAYKLEKAFPDVKAEFWLDLENAYQLNLLRRSSNEDVELKTLSLNEIADDYQFNYLFKGLNLSMQEKANDVLSILGVRTFQQANDQALKLNSLFFKDTGNPKAQYLWLKLCEYEFDLQNDIDDIKEFNIESLRKSLPLIKRVINTTKFDFVVNNLRKLLNRLGVALVVLEAVPNSSIRGAVTVIDSIPTILLSTRYKTFDSFYFTLFHELKHLLNDDLNNNHFIDISYEDDEREFTANTFARKYLINDIERLNYLTNNINNISDYDLINFANQQGVIVDIVIGFLEHDSAKLGLNIYNKYQHLRTRLEDE